MARPLAWEQHRDMDAMGMVLMALGSLALLELAAVNLRGEQRRPRSARSASRPSTRR